MQRTSIPFQVISFIAPRLLLTFATVAFWSSQALADDAAGTAVLRVGILKVKEWPVGGEAVSFAGNSQIKSIGAPGLDLFAKLMGSDIDVRRKLQAAAAAVEFSASETLDRNIPVQFTEQGMNVLAIDDPMFTNALRDDANPKWPANLDYVVDVQVNASGYYPARRAGGFSPMLYVVARLYSTKTGTQVLKVGYDADYRESEGERRFLTTPKEISVGEPDEIVAKRLNVKQKLAEVAQKMAALLAIDVKRKVSGLPNLP